MISIIDEIHKIRTGKPFNLEQSNSNRYRVLVNETDGTKTAYYFSTPIYSINSGELLDLEFSKNSDDTVGLLGSNAAITISDFIHIENHIGFCNISLNGKVEFVSTRELRYNDDIIIPSTNGIAYIAKCSDESSINFNIEVNMPFMDVRTNDKCFALMYEKFRPFVIVSCIGTLDKKGEVIAPAAVFYQKLSDKKYAISIKPCIPSGDSVMFELNLYESKLFQDTTVESLHPKVNNAFGGVGFIGNTEQYGEQWLYSRPDYSKMSDIMHRRARKVILHAPKHNTKHIGLKASGVVTRFCSFGSNWENKILQTQKISDSFSNESYQSIDITKVMIDTEQGYFRHTNGFVLRGETKGNEFSVVSTGDSGYAPQILEINFK